VKNLNTSQRHIAYRRPKQSAAELCQKAKETLDRAKRLLAESSKTMDRSQKEKKEEPS